MRTNILHFDPALPDDVGRVKVQLRYRRQLLDVEVNHDLLRITAGRSRPPRSRLPTAGVIATWLQGICVSSGFSNPGNGIVTRTVPPEAQKRSEVPTQGFCRPGGLQVGRGG